MCGEPHARPKTCLQMTSHPLPSIRCGGKGDGCSRQHSQVPTGRRGVCEYFLGDHCRWRAFDGGLGPSASSCVAHPSDMVRPHFSHDTRLCSGQRGKKWPQAWENHQWRWVDGGWFYILWVGGFAFQRVCDSEDLASMLPLPFAARVCLFVCWAHMTSCFIFSLRSNNCFYGMHHFGHLAFSPLRGVTALPPYS